MSLFGIFRAKPKPAANLRPWVEFIGGPIDELRIRLGPGATFDFPGTTPRMPAVIWRDRLAEVLAALPEAFEWPSAWHFGWNPGGTIPESVRYKLITRTEREVLYGWRP